MKNGLFGAATIAAAMAFGLPVVTTRRGILPELVAVRRPGEVPGIACEESAAALAVALVALLRDGERRRRMGDAALRRARLDMDPLRAAQRTRDLYAELLAERVGAGR